MEPDQVAGLGSGVEAKRFCYHRRSIVKRWQEGNEWFAILKCRWCDDWTRKVITLNEKSQNGKLKMITEKYEI